MSLIEHTSLSSPKDLQVLLSKLNGNFDSLSVSQIKDLLSKVSEWRESHASGEFLMSQNMYIENAKNRKAPEYSEEAEKSLNGKKYKPDQYEDSNPVTNLQKKKKELQDALDKALENEAASDQIPKNLPKNAHVDVDTGIVTVTSKPIEAEIMNEFPRKEEFKKPKKPRVTIPDPFKFDRREAQRKQTISERKFEEYIESIRKKEDELISYRFTAQPIPPSTLEPRYKDMIAQSKSRSEEIKESSKKWLLKSQRPFEFLKTTKYEDKKKQNLEKISKEMEFVKKSFKANPVPEWMDEKKMHIFEEENKIREKRIKERALQTFEIAKLPPRMEMWKSVDLGKKKDKSKEWNKELTFKPKLNTSIPNFSKLQKEFDNELSKRKQSFKPVEPEPPRCFGESSLTDDRLAAILADMKHDEEVMKEQRWPYASPRKSTKPTQPPDFSIRPQTPEKTKTILLREELVRKHLENEKLKIEKMKEEEENFFRPRLSSSLRRSSSNPKKRPSSAGILQSIENNTSSRDTASKEAKMRALQDAAEILEKIGDPDLIQRVSNI